MGLAMALAGGLKGAGDHLVEKAREAREAARRKQERDENRRDRLEDREYRRNNELSDRADDRRYREGYRDEARAYDQSQRASRATADTNVYASLFGTESGGNFGAQNSEGYTGRSQFGDDRLADYSRANSLPKIDKAAFKQDKALQKKVEQWHFADINNFIDKNDLTRFEGQTIGGVKITRSGIIAMAHLGGSGGAKRFLESGGEYNPSDSNGTSLSAYAQTHGGKETSMSGVWDAISDPDVSPAVRDKAVATIATRKGLGAATKLTGEEWIERDGKEVLMGRDGSGNMRPYKDDKGAPITRTVRDTSKPKSLSSSMSKSIDEWADGEVLDPSIARKFKLEVERLIKTGMSETKAWDTALATANKTDDVVTKKDGWIRDTETVTPGGYDGTFGKKEKPVNKGLLAATGADKDKPRATPEPPKEPSTPKTLPRPKTKAEFDALPSGARFIDPDGKVRRKP